MVKVIVGKNDSLDKALKIFKSKVQKAGIIQELKERQEYVKPSVKRRNEKLKAQHRNQFLSANN